MAKKSAEEISGEIVAKKVEFYDTMRAKAQHEQAANQLGTRMGTLSQNIAELEGDLANAQQNAQTEGAKKTAPPSPSKSAKTPAEPVTPADTNTEKAESAKTPPEIDSLESPAS